jgi:hypothetical protein
MRDAKDIRNKSAEDMAAVFGVKADFYKGLNAAINIEANAEVAKESKNPKKKRKSSSKNDEGQDLDKGERRKKKKKKDKK